MMKDAESTSLALKSEERLDLAGSECLSPRQRVAAASPLMMLVLAGAPALYAHPVFITALLVCVAIAARAGVPALARETRRMVAPSEAVQMGVGAFSAGMLLNALHWYFGRPFGHIPIFWFFWPLFTAIAVQKASKTDTQSGWAAGASSMAAFGLIRALGAVHFGGHLAWLLWLMAGASGVAGYKLWRVTGTRGRDRSRAALGAVLAGLAAATGAAAYCAFSHHLLLAVSILFVPLHALIAPLMKNRERFAGIGGEAAPMLPSGDPVQAG